MDVAVATDRSVPALDPDNRLLLDELVRRGLDARAVVWDDAAVDWSTVRLCVLRSTWDYVGRHEEFLEWTERVAAASELWNDAATIRWNCHKRYLTELAARRVRIVPTVLLARGARVDLGALLRERRWAEAVVKPAVSAGGRDTVRVRRGGAAEAQAHLDALLARGDVLVQRFLEHVLEAGETSLVYLDGAFSHAVRLRPADGEFRVQPAHGGAIERVGARTTELLFADFVLETVGRRTRYARVDLLLDGRGEPCLNELELIEPRLHFRFAPEGVARFADAVQRRLAALPA